MNVKEIYVVRKKLNLDNIFFIRYALRFNYQSHLFQESKIIRASRAYPEINRVKK